MSFLNSALGGMLGFAIGGPLGGILGAVLGSKLGSQSKQSFSSNQRNQAAFFTALLPKKECYKFYPKTLPISLQRLLTKNKANSAYTDFLQ